jgi:uncharacterized membrane protein
MLAPRSRRSRSSVPLHNLELRISHKRAAEGEARMSDPRVMDTVVLTWLLLCWLGYPRLVAMIGRRRSSIDSSMLEVRKVWMYGMLHRDFRVPDTMLLGQVIQSVAFFASGTIIVVGALVGALARVDSLAAFSEGFVSGTAISPGSIRLALLALLGIFIYGFFKFTWTLRQYNYCIAMIGAAPMPPIEAERHLRLADALARSITGATLSFNAGLRCYYFAFATLAWFLHPLLVPVTVSLTMIMLIRRQFYSDAAINIAAVLAEYSLADMPDPVHLKRLL